MEFHNPFTNQEIDVFDKINNHLTFPSTTCPSLLVDL
jgi:hypothetical protein